MSIATTNNLKLAHAEFMRQKRAIWARALWDAATKAGGLGREDVARVLWLTGPSPDYPASTLKRAIRDGHLIEVRRHHGDGRVESLYQPFGPRP